MAASSDNQTLPTETLIPSVEQSNGHDSTEQPHQIPPEQSEPSNPQPTDSLEPVEKRKRAEEEEQAVHPLWKTSLCSYFRRSSGLCSHGDACRYAHSEEELRIRPDNTWDPSSDRAKKVLKTENGEKSKPVEVECDVLMTDALDGDSSDPALSKCMVNLPMRWTSDNLRNFLREQGIVYKSAKKKKGMKAGFVNFESEEQVKRAMEELDGRCVGNQNLKVVDVVPRSFDNKTKFAVPTPQSSRQTIKPALVGDNNEVSTSSNGCEDGDTSDDIVTLDYSASKARSVRDVVTPLAHVPYVDQLEHKKNNLTQILKRLTRNARKACPKGVSLPEWILRSREIGGLPCKLEGIVESPLVNGYRNKCEFSVGYSVQGKPTVGFMLGNFREGVTAVEEPTNCPNVSTVACKYAAIFQEFLQCSGLPIWNRFNNSGFWRQLTVREGRSPGKVAEVISEVMLIVQVCTLHFDDELVNSEFERMAQAFAVGPSADSPLPLTSLVVQDHQGISNAAPADAPLRSIPIPKAESDSRHEVAIDGVEARIHDYISNLRFCISPTAFFQVNTLAAEKLYSLAGDWAGLGPDTLLFDICCGTGTIGLTLAHRVGKVVGIEMNASAVLDAERNAEINGIKNCRFVCAKAENVMGSLLKEYLNLPQKQDEIANSSEKNNAEPVYIEEKGTSLPDYASDEGDGGLEPEGEGEGEGEVEGQGEAEVESEGELRDADPDPGESEGERDQSSQEVEVADQREESEGKQSESDEKEEYGQRVVTSRRRDVIESGSERSEENHYADNEDEEVDQARSLSRSPGEEKDETQKFRAVFGDSYDEEPTGYLVQNNVEEDSNRSPMEEEQSYERGLRPEDMVPDEDAQYESEEENIEAKIKEKPVGPPLELEIPFRAPPAHPDKMNMIKVSNIMGIDPKPFDPKTYVEEDIFVADESGSKKRIRLDNNIVRWRIVRNPDGTESYESNARFVRWSDGSLQLLIGNEVLDLSVQDAQHDQVHLFLRHGKGILQSQGRLLRKMRFMPSSLSSNSHRLLTALVDSRHKKVYRVKNCVTDIDPEREKEQKEKAESQTIRNNELLNRKKEKVNRKYTQTVRRERQLSPGFLEDALDEDDEGDYHESRRSAARRRFEEDLEMEARAEKRIINAKKPQGQKDMPRKSSMPPVKSSQRPVDFSESEREESEYETEGEEDERSPQRRRVEVSEQEDEYEDDDHDEEEAVANEASEEEPEEPKQKAKEFGGSLKRKEIESDEDSPPRKTTTTHRRMAIVYDSDEE